MTGSYHPELQAVLDGGKVQREIEIKAPAARVVSDTLEIVPAAELKDPSRVVGSCAGGSQKIIYRKNA